MYFVILKDRAIGPFLTRLAAYAWAGERDLDVSQYAVKSDRVCQQEYQFLPIEPAS